MLRTLRSPPARFGCLTAKPPPDGTIAAMKAVPQTTLPAVALMQQGTIWDASKPRNTLLLCRDSDHDSC